MTGKMYIEHKSSQTPKARPANSYYVITNEHHES